MKKQSDRTKTLGLKRGRKNDVGVIEKLTRKWEKMANVTDRRYTLLYDFVDEKMVEGDEEAERMIAKKGYKLTYDELYDYVDQKMVEGDENAAVILEKVNLMSDVGSVKGKIKYFIYRDIEEPGSEQKMTEAQVKKYIKEWNESMETNYKDYKDFNKGEDYYEIMPIKK